ncbi:hypothetical protein Tco_1201275 [Tanacetum coccineum]
MSKTRADYGSGVARPKIEDKDNFELKGHFIKELRTNTFSGSDHEDANEHIEKVPEIVNLFYISNITIDKEVILFYNGLGIPTRQILNSRGAIPLKTAADANIHPRKWTPLHQRLPTKRRREYPRRSLLHNNFGWTFQGGDIVAFCSGTSIKGTYDILHTKNKAAAHSKLKEIIKTLEIQMGQFQLPIEADSYPIRRIGSSQYAVSTGQNRTLMYETRQMTIPFPSHLNGYYYEEKRDHMDHNSWKPTLKLHNPYPKKEKTQEFPPLLPCFINNVCFDNALVDLGSSVSVMPLSTYLNLGLGELAHTKLIVELADRPFLSTARAKIDVYKRKITLRVGEERIIFTSVKPASSLIKRVYMLSLRERMELDLESRLMGENLVLNRSLDLFFEDYIKLNDLNEPFELRRNQGDDLMPTIEEGKVIEEFRTRDDELDIGIDDYPSYCNYDKKIHIDCAHNLKFSCMIGFEFTHANFFPLLYVNVMSKKFHNSIIKEKMVYKGNNFIGALMNVPIFVGTFFVVTNFAVIENMDAYRDEGMGDVIFGKPF